MKKIKIPKFLKKDEINIEEKDEQIDYIGFVLSRKFKYFKLMKAADIEGEALREGREVHGYMQRMFRDIYKKLTKDEITEILDRACLFAWKDYKPEVYKIIDEFKFKYRSLVILKEKKAHFKHFPLLEFDRIIVYANEPINKVFTWLFDQEFYTDDGYETLVDKAPCGFLNMGSPIYDLPILVVSYALGWNKLFFQAKTSSGDLTKERNEVLRKQIFKIRAKEINMESQKEEQDIKIENAERKYSDLKYDMLSMDSSTDDERFARWERRNYKSNKHGFTLAKSILIILAVVGIILLVVIIPTILKAPKTPTEIPETANLISQFLFNRGI
ncbi:hypothetical protein LCGC14_0963290 [marine sediment metagenome]|uniref:Uncharacterized protein n=1 Tax=marine sediment metagenome TaxID=412755 RepID=A0A0F9QX11_9ZZZZ